ncbi:MAG: exo-alpha-sialidase [Oscillospiraceae bacterium]|jgi:hypothetical protein|nr:exo-alpha-sialidase [Oscillospiraceae bacterium]
MPELKTCSFVWAADIPYPEESAILPPAGMRHIIAHDGRKDILPFLLDVSLAHHGGRLYAAWYNSTDAEICGTSLIRGVYSEDGGDSWSEPFVLAGSFSNVGRHCVPVNFFPCGDDLYALVTEMSGRNMTTALKLYKRQPGGEEVWTQISQVADGFITNTNPIKMDNGNWIVGGWTPRKNETPAFPVALISQGDDIAAPWRCRFLYDPLNPDGVRIRCPEITLHAQSGNIVAYVRNGNGDGPAYIYESVDYGSSWSEPALSPMPIAGSKMCAGILADGRRYLVYNAERGNFVRTLLCIAVAEPGSRVFSKVYRLFEGGDAALGGRGRTWFYPAKCEFGGYLYIGCTLQEADNVRSAVIAKVPLASL